MRSKISRIQSPTPPPFPRSIAASAAAPSSANENSSSTSSSSSPDAEMTPAVLRAQVDDLAKQVESALAVIDLPAARARLAKLEEKASDENLWDDRAAAEELLRSVERCREEVEEGRRLQELLDDAQAAAELAVSCSSSGSGGGSSGNSGGENAAEAATPSENDSDALAFAAEGFSYVSLLRKALDDFELSRLLSGEFDGSDATVSIQAGAGGTEAMDWVSRVFCLFFFYRGRERKERKMSREEKKGVAGEKKTHSLSPSFSPSSLFQRDRKSERREKEREGKRREGREKGEKKRGKSEKVETAVRVRHIPSGFVVRCQAERSQATNKQKAINMIRAKLLVAARAAAAERASAVRGDALRAEWGQQVRNYVLHPYKQVKDLRTGLATSDASGVLDGQLEGFTAAFLRWRAMEKKEEGGGK